MSLIKKYIEYVRDNPKGYWFKRKMYGWGWTPARWQGWVVLLGYIAVIFLDFVRIDTSSHSSSDTLINFLPQLLVFTLVLIFICYKKGERPRWQWGDESSKRSKDDPDYPSDT